MLQDATLRRGLLVAAFTALGSTGACAPQGHEAGMGSAMAAESATAPATMRMASMPNVMVGGQPMLPSKTIVDRAVNSADHTTLVAAVKAAGLVDTLEGPGPFTVFAPVNSAFAALPPGTVDALLKPANRAALTGILSYHVVPGRLNSAALREQVAAGGGMARLKTVNGQTLTIKANGPSNLVIEDGRGGTATISTYDVYQSNGVIHVIDDVLLPG